MKIEVIREKIKENIKDKRFKRCVKALFIFYLLPLTSYLFAGCTGFIQKGGEFLEGKTDRVTAVYHSGNVVVREIKSGEGVLSLEVSNNDWPGLSFRGSMPDNNGRIHLSELYFLSSHVHGWNEFNLDVLGSAVFRVTNAGEAVLYIEGELERVQINSGKILLKGNMLSGTAALVPLRNRRERILALNEWMDEWLIKANDTQLFTDQKKFEDYWKPLLFPELVPQKSRPNEYSTANARWERSDSIRWNMTYTESIFPRHLWEYRNSGAMLRDWEEVLPWVFMEFSWDNIVSSFR